MIPYEMPPQGGLLVPASGLGCFTLKFPSRCWIVKLIVKQVDGPMANFTVQLFNKDNTCQGVSASDSDTFTEPSEGGLLPDVFEVTPVLPGTAGKMEYFAETTGGYGYVFCSQDKDIHQFHGARIGQNREIYLQIKIDTPDTNERTFCVGMAAIVWG